MTERAWRWLSGSRPRLIAAGASVFFALLLMMLGSGAALRYVEMRRNADALQREIQRLEALNEQLLKTIDRFRDDPQVIEQIAREELGLVKPGEKVLRFPPAPESSRAPQAAR